MRRDLSAILLSAHTEKPTNNNNVQTWCFITIPLKIKLYKCLQPNQSNLALPCQEKCYKRQLPLIA